MLALFLFLIAGNQGIEAWRAYLGAASDLALFRLATVFAALDPFVLYYFASIFPERNGLHRPWALGLVSLGGIGFTFGAAWMLPIERMGMLNILANTGLALYTALVYGAVLAWALVRIIRQPDERGWRVLVPAFAIAAMPPAVRTLTNAQLAWGVASGGARIYELQWLLVTSGVILAVVATMGASIILVARRTPSPAVRRAAWGGALAGTGITLVLWAHLFDMTWAAWSGGTPRESLQVLSHEGLAIRWLTFGGLVSVAVLRHCILDIPFAARRRAARVVVGLVVLMLAVGLLSLVSVINDDAARHLGPIEVVLLGAVLVASQGFRTLLDHVARILYDVPLPGDAVGRHEAYRQAAALVVAEGRSPFADARLARLREELGIDPAAAHVLDQVAEASTSRPVAPGQVLAGRYEVESMLGRGGGGRVFLARDLTLGRPVVVKEIAHDEAGGAPMALHEARTAGAIEHPNVVTVHDVLQRPGAWLVVSEYVTGGSLADHVASEGKLPADAAPRILDGLLEGLAAVHARGIVHRDLKPANVLLTTEGRPKIADFGIARAPNESTTRIAGSWIAMGTPAFMAPEQRKGEPATAATDVYAVGLLAKAVFETPLPPQVQAVVDGALLDDPAHRWPDAGAMLSALRLGATVRAPARDPA